jgi:hypothetical protein
VRHLSYANVVATVALFIALGGTSYAMLHVGSDDVVNNSLRSKDLRNDTIRSRDVHDRGLRPRDLRRNSLGTEVVRESALSIVPQAADAARVGGATRQDLRVRCPSDTVPKTGVCIETAARSPDGFLFASDRCAAAGRSLATMSQLDSYARSSGPLPATEWTANVYRNESNGGPAVDQLEAVVLSGSGAVSYDRVYLAVEHAFRCVALPSN